MKGKPLYPFALTAVLGIGLIIILSFIGLNQGQEMAGNDGNEQEYDNPIELGEDVYLQNCSMCHGENREGNGNPALNAVKGRLSAEDIVNTIAEGPGAMPPGLVAGEEAQAVAEYLLSESE